MIPLGRSGKVYEDYGSEFGSFPILTNFIVQKPTPDDRLYPKNTFRSITSLPPSNLALRNRLNPTQTQVNSNSHDPNNPEHLSIVLPIIPKNNSKHNPPEIPRRARAARHDPVSMGMHMRHEREIRAIARIHEEGHASHKPEHRVLVMRVCKADSDEEDAADDGHEVDPDLLAPDVAVAVDDVGDDAAGGAEGHVEEAEHGRPAPGAGLLEIGEVLGVVGAEDGVDGELGAEGAEVAACQDQGLRTQDHGESFFKAGLLDDFAAGGVEHLLLSNLGFVVMGGRVFAGGAVADLFGAAPCRGTARAGAVLIIHEASWYIDNGASDAVLC